MHTKITKKQFFVTFFFTVFVTTTWSQCSVIGTASDYTICQGQFVSLNASTSNSNATYTWNTSNGLTDSTIYNPNATPSQTTTYTVTITVPVSVELIPNGNFEAGNTGFYSDYTYSSSGGINSGQYSIVTNPANQNGGWAANMTDHTSGSGNMMIIDGGAFTNVWATTVSVQSNTQYNFSAWAASMGIGSSDVNIAQLMFKVNGVLIGSVYDCGDPGVWGNFTATWNSGTSTIAIIEIVDQQTNSAGNDFAIDDISFQEVCTATSSVTITVLEIIIPLFETIDPICQGEIAPFLPNSSLNVPPITGQWSEDIETAIAGSFSYTFTPNDPDQCATTTMIEVEIKAIPDISFIADTTKGCGPLLIHFMNQTPNTVSSLWDFGNGITHTGNEVSTVYREEGYYDVVLTVVITNGCMTSLTEDQFIYVNHNPVAAFIPSTENPSSTAESIMFLNTSSEAVTYKWTFGDGNSSTEINPVHYFTGGNTSFNVQLVAISEDGCSDTTSKNIEFKDELIYYVPNSFTPDGDDYNNTFQPVFTSGFNPNDYQMVIYNRWGEQLFATNDVKSGWDGIVKGEFAQDGIYTWKIEFTSLENNMKQVVTGNVNLLR